VVVVGGGAADGAAVVKAEAALIGGLLIDGAAIGPARSIVAPQDLARPRWREVYAAMLALDERGVAVDYVAVADELDARGTLGWVGEANLTAAINLCPTSAYLMHHARAITRAAADRRAEQLAAYAVPRPGAVVE
jgi:replicative DNA helicase